MGIFITAECGSTTKGKVENAIKCIDGAKEAGADAIKFIFSNPDELIADKSLMYEDEILYYVIDSYRMSDADWKIVTDYCKKINFEWFASIGTPDYVPLAVELGASYLKAGGWDTRNSYLFDAFLETDLPIMIDVCAVILGELENLLDYIWSKKVETQISLIYESHSKKREEINLNSIKYLKNTYGDNIEIGYSSNSKDIGIDKMAVRLGIDILEKRIKPDSEEGHHRDLALSPIEFKDWVYKIREVEKGEGNPVWMDKYILGREGLYPSMDDMRGKMLYFTSLVYDKDLKAGQIITKDCLASRRPGNGISSYYDYLWLGKELKKDVKRNDIVRFEDV